MNKKDIMRQPSMESLLESLVQESPGVTSQKLYDAVKAWAGKSWENSDLHKFDAELMALRGKGYRCTNKKWYPAQMRVSA